MKVASYFSLAVIILLVFTFTAFAGHKHGANVYKVDADGKEYAVCGCGHKLEVNETSKSAEFEGKTYYLCSDGCKEMFEKSTAQVKAAIETQVTKAKAEEGLLGNVYKVDEQGNKIAKCACGMDVTVTDKTPAREHDGQTYYLCGEKCAAAFDKTPAKVIKAAKKEIKTAKKDKA